MKSIELTSAEIHSLIFLLRQEQKEELRTRPKEDEWLEYDIKYLEDIEDKLWKALRNANKDQ